ncbi:zinc-dependent alcohol dehydrogenase family protein [Urbifossiella limnaea]|uniref:Alcohol dehydrogenase n=1 Tax=Urbifossiella limnaea TaxID=2528023 RepID=A0A517XSD7_9BACT|nr:NAD(P)-dependent alcohol dehydrogenase [Urbifossiella limnaea]QDU20426.1 Alcohol dehydrogenase [Urbifossiella limnaea]
MRAFVVRGGFGFDNLAFEERPDPVPGRDEVLVRVRAASLNFRDLLVARGEYNPKLPLPRVLGSDAAGEVVAVGENVGAWRVGDRVVGCFFQEWIGGDLTELAARSALGADRDGVLAELVVFSKYGLVPVPEHLSYEEAATLPCAAVTAWNALRAPGAGADMTVLIQGTGGVSVFALQLAKAMRRTVLVTTRSARKAERATALGADAVCVTADTPAWEKWAWEQTGGRGVDLVVEVGGAGTMEKSLRAVRYGGHIGLIGVLSGPGAFNPIGAVMKRVTIHGQFVGSRADFLTLNAALEQRQLRPVIDRVFRFTEARAAFEYLAAGGHVGKVVVAL